MAVNLTGAFLIGFVFVLFDESFINRDFRALVSVGFLGAYTTFSTFSLETLTLFRDGEVVAGAGNILMTNFLGLSCTLLGLYAGKLLLRSVKG
jgi:CrcB protein